MSSLGRSSFLSPEHQEWGHCPCGDIEHPKGIVQDRNNRGKGQEGEDCGCGLGVREPSVVMASVSLHGSGWTCQFT